MEKREVKMDKNKAIKTISRWIDFRLKAGYKIAGIGFKGMGEIRIRFKRKEAKEYDE